MRLRPRHFLVIALCLLGAGAALPSGAAGAVHHCNRTITIHNRLSALATVLATRNTGCRHARNVVRSHGRFFAPVNRGDRFRLGGFHCRVYRSVEEDHRARCTVNHLVFRVDYGS
jgi:hypothetical protein